MLLEFYTLLHFSSNVKTKFLKLNVKTKFLHLQQNPTQSLTEKVKNYKLFLSSQPTIDNTRGLIKEEKRKFEQRQTNRHIS